MTLPHFERDEQGFPPPGSPGADTRPSQAAGATPDHRCLLEKTISVGPSQAAQAEGLAVQDYRSRHYHPRRDGRPHSPALTGPSASEARSWHDPLPDAPDTLPDESVLGLIRTLAENPVLARAMRRVLAGRPRKGAR